ncbi:glycerophosphoryl diester phosphodiesterase, putative [Entamoeba invadens IP1]|uniref:Glycerophosphoryl diester phosphodiesterase, putative n=1 Tax=Entamoeba invadens IP1 TaxID=370355 RepID=A0A0A1U4Z3_ENTIV|nr:glycerophosphoryl diester phosphodiesterase, putative [Entamoeba invadens IP1]ELP89254.1 glycerophosphoryl diester phosphodiesterase, putative [Entamoeba invadens IP1]|eukprot:XP_004256025.1 glycerophosphoryl diester phosphodiesterase, putative [Entamoeba invadens IP1]
MRVCSASFYLSVILISALYTLNFFSVPRSGVSSIARSIILHNKPIIVAHRGGRGLRPENTLAAMKYTYEHYKPGFMESDIHITRDGEFIFIHDDTLDRTTNATGYVRDYTLKELRTFDFGYHFTDGKSYPYRGTGVQCSTLREGYEYLKDKNIPLSVEIKDRDIRVVDHLVDYLKTLPGYDRFMCFCIADNEMSDYFKEKTNYQLCYEGSEKDVAMYLITGLAGLRNLYYSIYPNYNRFHHEPFLSVGGISMAERSLNVENEKLNLENFYFTINKREDAAKCIIDDCDGMTSDRPDIIEELLVAIKNRKSVTGKRFDGVVSLDAKNVSWDCESWLCLFVDTVCANVTIPVFLWIVTFIVLVIILSVVNVIIWMIKLPFAKPKTL